MQFGGLDEILAGAADLPGKVGEALRAHADQVALNYELNRLVYNSEMRFEPVIGQLYYLYEKSDGGRWLSLVSPQYTSWPGFLCAVRLTTPYTWERIPSADK